MCSAVGPVRYSPASLLRLHQFAQTELSRYRDLEWKLPSILNAFLVAIFGAFGSEDIRSLIQASAVLSSALTLFALFACFMVQFSLYFTGSRMRIMWNLLSVVESRLGIQDVLVESGLTPAAKDRPGRKFSKRFNLAMPLRIMAASVAAVAYWLIWFV